MRYLFLCMVLVVGFLLTAQEGKKTKFKWSAERPIPPPTNTGWKPLWKAVWGGIGIKDVREIVRFQKSAYLGVRVEEVKEEKDRRTFLKVVDVERGSAAEKSGLKSGDLILKIDNHQVPGKKAREWFSRTILSKRPGDNLTMAIRRGNEELEFQIKLADYPVPVEPRDHSDFEQMGFEELSLLDSVIRNNALQDELAQQLRALYSITVRPFAPISVGQKYIPHPHMLSEVMYALRNPSKTPLLAEQIAGGMKLLVNTSRQDFGKVLRRLSDLLDVPIEGQVRTRDVEFTLEKFMSAMQEAAEDVKRAFSDLKKEETRALLRGGVALIGRSKMDEELFAKLFPLSYRVDYRALFRAAVRIFALLEPTTIKALLKSAENQPRPKKSPEGVQGKVLFYAETPLGRIVVGDKGRNIYTGRFALIIDIGGNDVYAAPVATANLSRPVSVVIDAGGDDKYIFGRAGGAAAVGGVSVLLDLNGNDTYTGGMVTEGAAVCGVALLADLAGSDTYNANLFSQGAALFGIGMLIDAQTKRPKKDGPLASCDRYSAHIYSQGVGLPRGVGLLLDTWGNDTYISGGEDADFRDPKRATLSLSQGFGYGIRPFKRPIGAAGGFGILIDENGHDIYVGDYFCQGSAYWFSMGILYDAAGSDHYICGRYSQGAGIHFAVGVLIDHAGNDYRTAYFGVSQGCGHDFGTGVLVDIAGNDTYIGGFLVQGAGNDGGFGFLLDVAGDDVYQTRKPKTSQPGARQHPYLKCQGLGVLVDMAGRDSYSAPRRKDSTTLILGKSEGEGKAPRRYAVFIDK